MNTALVRPEGKLSEVEEDARCVEIVYTVGESSDVNTSQYPIYRISIYNNI